MTKPLQSVLFGFLIWFIPFLAGFPFIDQQGNYLIDETFFKTIMIVIGSLVGVFFSVLFVKNTDKNYFKEGMTASLIWLLVNWVLDIIMVMTGFFKMGLTEYFTSIGLRYLSMPIFMAGLTIVIQQKLADQKKPEKNN